jgi:hypothetical protein
VRDEPIVWITGSWKWDTEQYYLGLRSCSGGSQTTTGSSRDAMQANGWSRKRQCTRSERSEEERATAIEKIVRQQQARRKRKSRERVREVPMCTIATLNIATIRIVSVSA